MATTTKDAKKAAKDAKKKGTGKVHLAVLMDESGSMNGKQEAVTTGCNEFLHTFRKNKQARAWLAMFDDHPGEDACRIKVKAKKIADVKDLTIGDYTPRGMTPLNDAILHLLSALDKKVADDETVFMAIITDGLENASEADAATVAAAIKRYEKKGWGFVYLGADHDAETSAARIGLGQKGQAFKFAKTGVKSTMRSAGGMAHAHAGEYVVHGAGEELLASSTALRGAVYDSLGGKQLGEDEDDE